MDTTSPPAPAKPTVGRVTAVLATLLMIATLVTPHASANPSAEASFVTQVNQYRTSRGLPPLQVDGQLTALARGWSGRMRDGVCGAGNHICHASPISAGVTHDWAKLGENVGTGGDVDSVMGAFIESEGHRNNIIDPEFTHIGVGVVWNEGRLYTTHRFMSLRGAPATTTTTAPPTTAAPTTAAPPPTTAAAPPTNAPSTAPAPSPTTATPTTSGPADPPRKPSPPMTRARADFVVKSLRQLR